MLETALGARIPPETLRKIESGRVPTPALPTIAAIADVLGLSDTGWRRRREKVGGASSGRRWLIRAEPGSGGGAAVNIWETGRPASNITAR